MKAKKSEVEMEFPAGCAKPIGTASGRINNFAAFAEHLIKSKWGSFRLLPTLIKYLPSPGFAWSLKSLNKFNSAPPLSWSLLHKMRKNDE